MALSLAERFTRWLNQQPTPIKSQAELQADQQRWYAQVDAGLSLERRHLAAAVLHTYAIYGDAPKDQAANRALLAELPLTPDAAVALLALGVAKQLSSIEARIMGKLDDFQTKLNAYYAQVDAYVAATQANQTNSDAAVAAAVQAEKDNEDVSVQALADTLAAEAAKVPAAPTAPPAVPAA